MGEKGTHQNQSSTARAVHLAALIHSSVDTSP